MNNSSKLDQKALKELLINIYEKGQENKDISLVEIINDIKSQIKFFFG